jgi:hypothetical protein
VINHYTVQKARETNQEIWKDALTGYEVLLLSPEQLEGASFESLLRQKNFWTRLWALAVDEIHLLDSWGAEFRVSFTQIGEVHARMPAWTVLIGVTATLIAGPPTKRVLDFLKLREGHYHLIRRSNIRRNLRIAFLPLTASLEGQRFPDLDWLLEEPGRPKALIFVKTIALASRIHVYLWHKVTGTDVEKRIRLRVYTALEDEDDCEETRRLMHSDEPGSAQITITTDRLIVGVDFRNVKYCFVFDANQTADDLNQKFGRIGRDSRRIIEGVAILYYSKQSLETARKIVAADHLDRRSDKKVKMDYGMARLLLGSCKRAVQDEIYNNPRDETPCGCKTCIANQDSTGLPSSLPSPLHAPSPLLDTSSIPCQCCGLPAGHPALPCSEPAVAKTRGRKPNYALTVAQGDFLCERLLNLRMDLFDEADDITTYRTPPAMFLPDHTIQRLAAHYGVLKVPEDIKKHIQDVPLLVPHAERLLKTLQDLWPDLQVVREAKAAETRTKKAAKAAVADIPLS